MAFSGVWPGEVAVIQSAMPQSRGIAVIADANQAR
jgi:hypothetical protein